jgi:hypothetical protein
MSAIMTRAEFAAAVDEANRSDNPTMKALVACVAEYRVLAYRLDELFEVVAKQVEDEGDLEVIVAVRKQLAKGMQ